MTRLKVVYRHLLPGILLAIALVGCNSESTSKPSFTVGGSITNLVGELTLTLNAGDQVENLTIKDNKTFTFPSRLKQGEAYSVAISKQPVTQDCSIEQDQTEDPAEISGTVDTANILIEISCIDLNIPKTGLTLTLKSPKTFSLAWAKVDGAQGYRLSERRAAGSGFVDISSVLSSDTDSFLHTVPIYDRWNALYVLEACATASSTPCKAVAQITAAEAFEADPSLVSGIGMFKATEPSTNAFFGRSIALSKDGTTLAIGEDKNGQGIGAVYVYNRDVTTGEWQSQVMTNTPKSDEMYGRSVSLSADGLVLAVGVPKKSSETIYRGGAVQVYSRPDTLSSWSDSVPLLVAPNSNRSARFGASVSLSADGLTLAVGAPNESIDAQGVSPDVTGENPLANSGAAYLFTRQDRQSDWVELAYIKAENPGEGDFFGTVVKLNGGGDTVAVYAPQEDSDALGVHTAVVNNEDAPDSGAVYLYQRKDDDTVQFTTFIKSSIAGQQFYGTAIDLSDDGLVMAVGAVLDDRNAKGVFSSPDSLPGGLWESGAVYVYARTTQQETWALESFIKAENAKRHNYFGTSVSLSDDGLGLVIGAGRESSSTAGLHPHIEGMADPFSDTGAKYSGAAYYYSRAGRTSLWSLQSYIKTSQPREGDAAAGDSSSAIRTGWTGQTVELSGDGETLAMSAPGATSPKDGIDATDDDLPNAGAVYLY
ncbi:hypothetical protein ABMA57_00350 [Saccharospirillum sp. HFRX-1]|uniref:hypothetical protein n=1 Tax=unclassified Saccharospirillum TaxID=2633430 RepID=UPI00371E4BC7